MDQDFHVIDAYIGDEHARVTYQVSDEAITVERDKGARTMRVYSEDTEAVYGEHVSDHDACSMLYELIFLERTGISNDD